jgi:hypothetical protein
MIILTAAFVVSCADDLDDSKGISQNEKAVIQLTVDDTQDWTNAPTEGFMSRSFNTQPVTITATGDVEGMVLVPEVTNGIRSVRGSIGKSRSSQGQATMTRGALQTSLASFGLSAYSYSNGQSWATAQKTTEIYNDLTTYNTTTSTWEPANGPYYWPTGATSVRFFGYSPYVQDNNVDTGIQLSEANAGVTPYIDFTVKSTIADQIDLMTGYSEPTQFESGVKARMDFRHALTCVKFVLGDGMPEGSTITRLKLAGIADHGRYSIGEGWTVTPYTTSKKDFIITNINTATNGLQNNAILSQDGEAASTLLMIPQEFTGSDQEIVLYYTLTGSSTEHYIKASLKETVWLEGTTVTYTLKKKESSFEYVFNIASAVSGHSGGEAFYTVTSYQKAATSGTKTPIPWKIVGYSTDGVNYTAEKPATAKWFNLINTSGDGSIAGERAWVKVSAQEGKNSTVDNTTQHDLMVANGTRGEDSPYDLSRHDFYGNPTLQNTANCYIINAPGTYKLPLVYGNAIKNGEENEEAYTSTLNTFVGYDGQPIGSPYIYETADPGDAALVWEDLSGLITNVTLNTTTNEIEFDVPSGTINQGNAVIAVRDKKGVIMWSWHIWVTGLNVMDTKRIINYERQVYYVMPYILGLCPTNGTMTSYDERSLYVKALQDGGRIATFKVQQPNSKHFAYTEGYAPFWQWGRKDPMQPGTGRATDKSVVSPTLNRMPNHWDATINTRALAIKNPERFYTIANGNWTTELYPDMWCAGHMTAHAPLISYRTRKTVYDPCPVGYHVPENYFLTSALSYVGTYDSSNTSYNRWSSDTNTWRIAYSSYCIYYNTDDEVPSTLSWPAVGYRGNNTFPEGSYSIGFPGSAQVVASQHPYNFFRWKDKSYGTYVTWTAANSGLGWPMLPTRE